MRRHGETHKPGKVTKIIPVPEVKEEQIEIEIDGAQPRHGRIRIVNFLHDQAGSGVRLTEGADVDVKFASDDVESK
jgi:hypothetical protein